MLTLKCRWPSIHIDTHFIYTLSLECDKLSKPMNIKMLTNMPDWYLRSTPDRSLVLSALHRTHPSNQYTKQVISNHLG